MRFLMKDRKEAERRLQEHQPLLDVTERLLGHLAGLEYRIASGEDVPDFEDGEPAVVRAGDSIGPGLTFAPDYDVETAQRYRKTRQYLARVISFGEHGEGILSLAKSGLYPAAFALTRVALEHHVVDRLLFLANKHEFSIQKEATRKDYEELMKNIERGQLNISPEERERIYSRYGWDFRAYKKSPDRGEILAIDFEEGVYWRYAMMYTPFPQRITTYSENEERYITDFDLNSKYSKEKNKFWKKRLSWSSFIDAMIFNRLILNKERDQFNTMHWFLDAYVHPVSFMARERLFSGNYSTYNHFAVDLILLQLCYLLCGELRAFYDLMQRPPIVSFEDWPEVENDLRDGEILCKEFAEATQEKGTDLLVWLEAIHSDLGQVKFCSHGRSSNAP